MLIENLEIRMKRSIIRKNSIPNLVFNLFKHCFNRFLCGYQQVINNNFEKNVDKFKIY